MTHSDKNLRAAGYKPTGNWCSGMPSLTQVINTARKLNLHLDCLHWFRGENGLTWAQYQKGSRKFVEPGPMLP